MRLGSAPDVDQVEIRRFQQYIPCPHMDLGLGPSHDSADADGAGCVGDEDVILVEGATGSVQRGHPFADAGLPHLDGRDRYAGRPGALQQEIIVKGMERLPQFHHHIVGDIHDIVYWPDSNKLEPALHPLRGQADSHISDESSGKAGRESRVLYLHPDRLGGWRASHHYVQRRIAHRLGGSLGGGPSQRSHFARHADHGMAASQVGGQIQVEYHLSQDIL